MNKSTLVPREELSDLDWLARNVHVWPAGDHQPWCYVYWKGGHRAVIASCITVIQSCVRIEKSEWLARRAELTKRDAAVCGGQKYLDAQWFERGELPPVGTVCLYVVSDRLSAEVEITAHAKLGLCFVQVGQSGESYVSKTAELHRFRPIRTEREELADLIESHGQMSSLIVADAILAAGFSLGAK